MITSVNSISIISLTYNNWRLLDNAFRSLVSQQLPNVSFIEYIVVDDASPDFNAGEVHDLAMKYGVADKFDFSVRQNAKNIGTVASFNGAIQVSKGDIIIPLSGDDCFAGPNVIGAVVKFFNKNNSLIVTGLRVPVIDGKVYENDLIPDVKYHWLFEGDEQTPLLEQLCLKKNIISGASTYYRREVFELLGKFDENYRLLEDFPFYEKALNNGVKIELLKEKTLLYSMNGISNDSQPHPLLTKDYSRLMNCISKNPNLSFWQKRQVVFNKVFDRTKRSEFFIVLAYLDCFLLRKYESMRKSLVKRIT
ncbi:glycosyltransferase [Agarivorans aestuarii]|uniref:Glycosyltransferase n=1 Tax=Agarivorans aestuarii TaxID=1563703 RepID=A0ABU7G9G7_9ALTE|nr:glycosyltransferase [Agarivorans aestuarii]MEE1676027.1 glycosyltransferase [Agarivorans aestuarii]